MNQSRTLTIANVQITLTQDSTSGSHATTIWPAGLLLSHYISSIYSSRAKHRSLPSLDQKSVVDLGSGTGICAIVASRVLGASWTFATDLSEHAKGILAANIAANRVAGDLPPARDVQQLSSSGTLDADVVVTSETPKTPRSSNPTRPAPPILASVPLDWLSPTLPPTLLPHLPFSLILGSDTLFSLALLPAFFRTLTALSGPRTIALLATESRDPAVIEEAWKEAARCGWFVKKLTWDKIRKTVGKLDEQWWEEVEGAQVFELKRKRG
ncbi:hypothetical protein M427DRAFT_37330 [Gonapodya prolifera JEL478]|uniref:S-adenosyl-L-methionine-dependent methyltransferase n=1 Tax=Gonapodya prolifera (strain JEL478) TaxID=1344416 RepID=A0A139A0S7_GONPJ|nr:hypothetical protein M427DRAFT_37330 [Gonapodya prolifera JEL478]|eukprot:KXS10380.1 hypothetical protein M427DRAFT_37330 [Gonapodya prolifera JEL478]